MTTITELRARFGNVRTAADAVALLDDAQSILPPDEFGEYAEEWAFAVGCPTDAFGLLRARDEKGTPAVRAAEDSPRRQRGAQKR